MIPYDSFSLPSEQEYELVQSNIQGTVLVVCVISRELAQSLAETLGRTLK